MFCGSNHIQKFCVSWLSAFCQQEQKIIQTNICGVMTDLHLVYELLVRTRVYYTVLGFTRQGVKNNFDQTCSL